uniref:Uncharacterized protein n=1 Tax=Physcomitrium patens TaxID=3218 RepID=A0A2K1KBA4_PHYPA|nr:hypothetical protein PHYPA_010235 [Physcomitrium patens]
MMMMSLLLLLMPDSPPPPLLTPPSVFALSVSDELPRPPSPSLAHTPPPSPPVALAVRLYPESVKS